MFYKSILMCWLFSVWANPEGKDVNIPHVFFVLKRRDTFTLPEGKFQWR